MTFLTLFFSTSVRDLGIILDQQLSFSGHIHALSRACFYQLRQLRVVTRSLSFASASLLVHAFVCSRLDYCSSLYAGLPLNKLNCLTKILRSSARLVREISRFDHVSDFMRDKLHWLPIFQRIRFRLACIAKSCINSLGPSYLCELFIPVTATLAHRSLLSASRGVFLVPFARTAKTKSRSFSVAGPTLWNDLPFYLRSTTSVSSGSFHKGVSDFRPISITSVLSRILEKHVGRAYFYPILTNPNINQPFSDQFAFRPSGSTTAALIALLHQILDILKTEPLIRLISLDFTRAFDSVSHSFLATVLSRLPIPDNIYNWVMALLKHRQHSTRYQGITSLLKYITASIIHGSGISTLKAKHHQNCL